MKYGRPPGRGKLYSYTEEQRLECEKIILKLREFMEYDSTMDNSVIIPWVIDNIIKAKVPINRIMNVFEKRKDNFYKSCEYNDIKEKIELLLKNAEIRNMKK